MRQPPDAAELADSGRDTLGGPGRGRRAPKRRGTIGRGALARWSTRRHLTALVAAVLVPILVFAGVLLWEVAQSQRRELQHEAVGLADTLAATVDRQLQGFVSALQVLASSPALDRGNIDAL